MNVAFTDRELDVMSVLWQRGPSTVAEVRAELSASLAYTTVLTVLRTLEDKGYAGHEEEGKAYRYHALVARETAGASAIRRLMSTVFLGQPELLLTQLVEQRALPDSELARLRALLDERIRISEEEESEP
ncbi:MAG TPA: BlaI/MecI/CopY family transcriptional regulator [Gemmatimonadales bacterium]|nr:BlaI/MecI/CopY family transcriptional regulator [Gemmatimonadales bacterium]